jgi:hypothetical protein
MRKIKLNVEALAVESFATDEAAAERGTVDAHSGPAGCSAQTLCAIATCIKLATCDYSICRVCPTA